MSQVDRRPSDIRLSSDVIDQNGQAIFTDSPSDLNVYATNNGSIIAPWTDYTPSPVPKSGSISSKGLFGSKGSFSSFGPQRQNSSSTTLRTPRPSDSQASLYSYGESTKRPSQDDSESSRGMLYSGSSANSGDLRSKKSSKSLFVNLGGLIRRAPSRAQLREDGDEKEHPSLKGIPPTFDQRGGSVFNGIPMAGSSSATLVTSAPYKEKKLNKKDKGKQKAHSKDAPPVPPKDSDEQEFCQDILSIPGLEEMEGVLKPDVIAGAQHASPPSSGFESSYSLSDHGSSIDWRNPFASTSTLTSTQDKRKGMINGGKLSPTSTPPHIVPRNVVLPLAGGSRSPGWSAPDSWVVEQRPGESNGNLDTSEAHDSGSDTSFDHDINTVLGSRRRGEERLHESRKHRASVSHGRVSRGSTRSSRQLTRQYKMRVYTQLGAYYVISIGLDTNVTQISDILREKLVQANDRVRYDLYIKEQGRERMLGPKECPAQLVKIKMEQAGYDADDSQQLLGPESLSILLRFYYKSQSLAGEEQTSLDKFDFIDLSGKSLRTIPVILHQNADSIISLHLDRNPMLDIPLDFIQSCTTLRDLWLTHMSMKKVPASLRHSTTLHRLNLSRNHIRDLDDAHLHEIKGLLALFLHNNRLDKLPVNFSQLRSLVTLNISNNRFKVFPLVITELENLRDLDISFNMITELPKEIGKMRALERLVIVGNQVTSFPDEASNLVALRMLDCKRNQISDLSLICMLPNLQTLISDHNTVHALDLSLGPHLTTLDVSHNDITRLSLVPGPMGKSPYSLTSLDLSYGKLASLDDTVLSQLTSLRTLKLDHNSINSIPDSLGNLRWLEILSCTDNKLRTLPSTIGKLQKLQNLDAHNNSLTELPQSIWNCASLMTINVTSNVINGWHDPPAPTHDSATGDGGLAAPNVACRRPSTASVGSLHNIPPLVHSLEALYLGENCLTDDNIRPLMIFKALKVLNMSFNEIPSLPPAFFRNMISLEELYLSGNRLTSLPAEDFPRLTRLTTIFLNGNKLTTLPQELGKVPSLTVLDVGSNLLKYNVNNWEFDWNWNFNTNLKYLNLSGNKRLQIKADSIIGRMKQLSHGSVSGNTAMLSGFTSLSQLKVLGLIDVTITTTGKDATVDIPDENVDRRVRTSLSTVCGMGYGIADSLSKTGHLTMIDLVHEFHGHGRKDEAIFAMFGQTHYSKHLKPGTSTNLVSKFLHDNFVNVFKTQLAAINDLDSRRDPATLTHTVRRDGIKRALQWTFLKLNQDLHFFLASGARKQSQSNMPLPLGGDAQYYRVGASGIALYIMDKTIYAGNVGDSLAVVSRQGIYHEISKRHDPYDRVETARIRAAEGSISPPGLVNEEVEVSRSFGYFHMFPTMNARPDIFVYDLTDMDEFVIIANRGLWNYVPYQTAVDIARTMLREEHTDPMLAAQKLRDIAISYGSSGSTMVMIILVADLFKTRLTDVVDYRAKKKQQEIMDLELRRLPEAPAPVGHVTLVFTDIRNSTHLWEVNPGMPTAIKMHNALLRRHLRLCGGYEVKTEGDAFMCSFPTSLAAVWWCLTVQVELLNEQWPLEILECEDGKSIYDEKGNLIARGLSVRMGIHSGTPLCETDLLTHRMDYFGPMVNRSARINSNALGGQIMCSLDIVREINARVFESEEETEYSRLQTSQAIEGIRDIGVKAIFVGEVKLKGIELPEILHVLYPRNLEGRHELKEPVADPTASASRVQFSVPQIKELGLVCLRLEALSTGRIFKPTPDRKGSIQSNSEKTDSLTHSLTFRGDPNLLLPSINGSSSDADLMLVLDSLSLRIVNAIAAIVDRTQTRDSLATEKPKESNDVLVSPNALLSTLSQGGRLDQDMLTYIASILACAQ